MIKPKYYIETRWQKVAGYQYEQPIEYCNGIPYNQYAVDSYERMNWGKLSNECKWFNECLRISRYNDDVWTNETARDEAFDFIYNNKRKGEGIYTQLKDFEIWLMCNGYNMQSFDRMCAQSPCVVFIIGKGWQYTRFYYNKSNGRTLYFCFGVKGVDFSFNFYFVHSDDMNRVFQVPIKKDDFILAENMYRY